MSKWADVAVCCLYILGMAADICVMFVACLLIAGGNGTQQRNLLNPGIKPLPPPAPPRRRN